MQRNFFMPIKIPCSSVILMKSTTDIPLREAAELKRADFRKGLNQRSITKTELGIVVTASVVFASTYAISKGQDINWD